MQLLTAALLALVLVVAVVTHFIKLFREINRSDGIPGPIQIPYLGRIHDLPIHYMWLKLKEWGDKYGGTHGFYQTEMLGCKVLVITDEKVAEDLLVRRAKYNSDRPLIRSLFDSKTSCEYLPLMGRNREPPSSPASILINAHQDTQTSGRANASSPTPTSPRPATPTTMES